jgi:23S rRNA (adenine-N6)-dimethyltransferase
VAVRPRSHRGSGQHFLRSSKLAAELVRAARAQRGDLVLDLGAGTGALTSALRGAGARVVAVELDPLLADGLRQRFPDMRIQTGDALRVALPREPFSVVANLPFDGATSIMRRLLEPSVQLRAAHVIVDWRFATKRAAVWPSTQLSTYWAAWFELSIERRLSRCVFAPPPTVDAALFRAVRRAEPLVPAADARRYAAFLARGYRAGPRAVVAWNRLKRCEAALGFDRHAAARDLDASQWAALFVDAVRRNA